MSPILFLILPPFLLGLWVAWSYNRLVRARNMYQEGWSGIDVQLKRRWDLVPNLVSVVQGYAKHENAVFEKVARVRSQNSSASTLDQHQRCENELTHGLKQLLVVVEAYPELKAASNFLELQKSLVEVEEELQMARRYYNGSVRDYNILVESVPGNLVAFALGFKSAPFFEIETATERAAPQVKL